MYWIDSSAFDFRSEETVEKIFNDIISILQSSLHSPVQLELFGAVTLPSENSTPELRVLKCKIAKRMTDSPKGRLLYERQRPPYPYAYIAAPFTSVARPPDTTEKTGQLFTNPPTHGRIAPYTRYRNTLLKLSQVVESIGLNSLLPHRDVNEWGKKLLSPAKVMASCVKFVSQCDVFIGLLGDSLGSHLEFGIALGRSKPCIIIECDEIPLSFIAKGITHKTGQVLICNCKTMEEIPLLMRSDNVKSFIARFIELGVTA